MAQNRDEVTEAVLAFVFAESWEESERIVEERRGVLLTDAADEELAALITSNKDDEDTVCALKEHQALLARCREKGIDTAFAERSQKKQPFLEWAREWLIVIVIVILFLVVVGLFT